MNTNEEWENWDRNEHTRAQDRQEKDMNPHRERLTNRNKVIWLLTNNYKLII